MFTKNQFAPAAIVVLFVTFFLMSGSPLAAADPAGYAGWDKDSPYNQLYNFKDRDTFKGVVKGFKTVTPLPGMDPGTALLVDDGGDSIVIHLCPVHYASAEGIGLRKGDKVKVSGSWAMVGSQEVFIAAKIKWGDNAEFKVRLTSDGTPFWTMTPEELEREGESTLAHRN
jgi:hypothetical protein